MDSQCGEAREHNGSLGVAWGAEEIARVINRKPSQVYYMLRKGQIKAARKTGDQHHASIAGLKEQFG
jgi:hypothetical protein